MFTGLWSTIVVAQSVTLTVATYNCEFLWDGRAPEEGQVNFPWKFSPDQADEHMESIAKVIKETNADIINLVEVESFKTLKYFDSAFLPNSGYTPYLVKGTDTYTGQDVGLLTKYQPVDGVIFRYGEKGRSGDYEKSVSKNFYAKFVIDNRKIAVIGVHFLARPDDSGRRLPRQAQANAILNLAVSLENEGYELIIMGDFNDYDGDPSCSDHLDHMPITTVLSDLKAMQPDSQDDDLINVEKFIAKSGRYTAFWDKNEDNTAEYPGEFSDIDHILVSKSLEPKIVKAKILNYYNPIGVSDHYPVSVTFNLADNTLEETGIKIISLLPNPAGDETQNEMITLKNFGGTSQSLTGWKVKDAAGRIWTLDAVGSISAGAEVQVLRQGQTMALNNSGDTVYLLDSAGNTMQTIVYGAVEEGEVVNP